MFDQTLEKAIGQCHGKRLRELARAYQKTQVQQPLPGNNKSKLRELPIITMRFLMNMNDSWKWAKHSD